MKKIVMLLLVCLTPGLLAAQALHQWTGTGQVDGMSFELKLVIMENEEFIVLVETEEAPFAANGTWKGKDDHIFDLSVTTEKVMDEELPIRKGTLYIVETNTAVIVAEGFGIELKRYTPPAEHAPL